jgi:hypothetical protein
VETSEALDQSFASTAPTPMPQTPYLQSGRLMPPAMGGSGGLNKTLLTKMDQTLAELKIAARPVPTKRVCDLYDSVRKDVLTLLTLQKMLMQKEGILQAKRVKLFKMGGKERVLDEETLLGITPPPPPANNAATASASKSTKAARPSKSKAPASSTGGSKSKASTTPKAKADDSGKSDSKDTSTGGAKKPKTAAKRKRKSDPKNPAPAPVAPAAAATAGSVPVSASAAAPVVAAVPPAKPTAKPATTGDAINVDQKQPGGKKRARKS